MWGWVNPVVDIIVRCSRLCPKNPLTLPCNNGPGSLALVSQHRAIRPFFECLSCSGCQNRTLKRVYSIFRRSSGLTYSTPPCATLLSSVPRDPDSTPHTIVHYTTYYPDYPYPNIPKRWLRACDANHRPNSLFRNYRSPAVEAEIPLLAPHRPEIKSNLRGRRLRTDWLCLLPPRPSQQCCCQHQVAPDTLFSESALSTIVPIPSFPPFWPQAQDNVWRLVQAPRTDSAYWYTCHLPRPPLSFPPFAPAASTIRHSCEINTFASAQPSRIPLRSCSASASRPQLFSTSHNKTALALASGVVQLMVITVFGRASRHA